MASAHGQWARRVEELRRALTGGCEGVDGQPARDAGEAPHWQDLAAVTHHAASWNPAIGVARTRLSTMRT